MYAIYASTSRRSIVKYEAVENARDRRKKQERSIRSVVIEGGGTLFARRYGRKRR